MRRHLYNFAVAVSLVLCAATAVLWVRSYRHPGRFGISTPHARYTFHSTGGRVALYRPPDPAPQTALAWQMVSQICNDDIVWTGERHAGRLGTLLPPVWYHASWRWKPESPSAQMIKVFPLAINKRVPAPGPRTFPPRMNYVVFAPSISSVAPPLLKALEDPRRAAVASMYLALSKGGGYRQFEDRAAGDLRTVYIDEFPPPRPAAPPVPLPWDLPIRFRVSELAAVSNPLPNGPNSLAPATPDTSGWRELRDFWHDQLDVKAFSFSYAWLVAATALLPLAWLIGLIRALRMRRPGHCSHCGYNLAGNISGTCPECGAACNAPNAEKSGGTAGPTVSDAEAGGLKSRTGVHP